MRRNGLPFQTGVGDAILWTRVPARHAPPPESQLGLRETDRISPPPQFTLI
jgi:hypothetical protein